MDQQLLQALKKVIEGVMGRTDYQTELDSKFLGLGFFYFLFLYLVFEQREDNTFLEEGIHGSWCMMWMTGSFYIKVFGHL